MPGDRATYERALQQGNNFAWDGRWAEAVQAYQHALNEFPDDLLAHTNLGQAYLELGRHADALKHYQNARKLSPGDPALMDKIAEIQSDLGHTDEAVVTSLLLAERHMDLEDRAAAVATWRRVIQWAPNHEEARRRLSEVYATGGSRRDIDAAVEEALALARVYQGRGDIPQAIQECERALSLDNTHVETRALLEDLRLEALESGIVSVSAATRRGSPIDQATQDAMARLAEQVFEERIASGPEIDLAAVEESTADGQATFHLGPQQLNALIGQAIDFQARDMLPEAIARYEEARRGGSRQPEVVLNLGILYLRQGRWDQAIELLVHTATHPDCGLASQVALGQAHLAREELDHALRHFVEALKIVDLRTVEGEEAQNLAQLYAGLAESYITDIEPEEATAFCNSLTEFLNDEDWEQRVIDARQRANALAVGGQAGTLAEFFAVPAYDVVMEAIALSQEYLSRGYLMAAIDQCQRVIEHAPGYLPIHRRLAEIYAQQGRLGEATEKYAVLARTYEVRGEPNQAIQIYRDMLAIAPEDMTIHDRLTSLLQGQGRYDDAVQHYVDTAVIYLQTLQVDEAVECYAQALKLAPHTKDVRRWAVKLYCYIAEAYASRVDWSRAISALLQAKKLTPEDEGVRRQLAELYMKQGRSDLAQAELAGLPSPSPTVPSRAELRDDDTLERLRVRIRRDPNDLNARQALAQAYAARGLKQEAVTELDTLGELLLNQGRFQDALQTIEAIVDLDPPNVNAYRKLLHQLRQRR